MHLARPGDGAMADSVVPVDGNGRVQTDPGLIELRSISGRSAGATPDGLRAWIVRFGQSLERKPAGLSGSSQRSREPAHTQGAPREGQPLARLHALARSAALPNRREGRKPVRRIRAKRKRDLAERAT